MTGAAWRAVRHRAQESLALLVAAVLLGLYAGMALLALAGDRVSALYATLKPGGRHV